MQKFKINNEIELLIGVESSFYITQIGLPEKIIYQTYDFYIEPVLENHRLILGCVKDAKIVHELYIDLNTNFVMHQWNYPEDSRNVFINSSIKQLIECIQLDKCFVEVVVKKEYLGSYHISHPTYSNMLNDIIFLIDQRATENGMWKGLIEEMKLGVI